MRNRRFGSTIRSLVRAAYLLLIGLLCVGRAIPADASQETRFLAKEDILLFGIGLEVEPAEQTVPKDIATIVSATLRGPVLPDGVSPFPPDARVLATLRGPGLPQPMELSVQPNTPFNIPPLNVAGIHSLDNIRLVSNGEVIVRGTPESATIEVIDRLLVTHVTARPLTAEEIRERGILFDESSFQAYNFTAAFAIENRTINISFPVVLPTLQSVADVSTSTATVPTLSTLPKLPTLKTLIPDTLKVATQFPNLSVVGFTLKAPALAGQEIIVPPIPGVVVIPGDIGFLNQFFSVLLMVGNVAPDGSNLVVTDLQAEIVLPPGNDSVAGSADDPLRMARTADGEVPRVQPVIQPGADGQLHTADDIKELGPGDTGNAEYLVEGRREGSHVVEMTITGTLLGLPVGPITVNGRAAGSVLVRNPDFTLTFTHPDTVTAGEAYTLDVTVTNTSPSPANLVSVNLFPRNISGAMLVGESSRAVDSIPPGDSATVSFDLVSRVTGKVTAATLDADTNIAGQFSLKHAVGELGVPLSPDSLVLPAQAQSLSPGVRDAAIALLGKAWAFVTAPAAARPKDLTPFSKKIVLDRAVEVAEAGFRVQLHEPMGDSATQLLLDFMGSNFARLAMLAAPADLEFEQSNFLGFDELRRKSVRGDVLAQAVAAELQDDLAALGVSAFHHDVAEKISYRPGHISVLLGTAGAPLPFTLSIVDGQERRVGGRDSAGKVFKEIPFSDHLTFENAGMATAQMAFIAAPEPGELTIRLDQVAGVPDDTPFTLSLVVPDADGALRHIVYEGITGQDRPAPEFAAADPYRIVVALFFDGAPSAGDSVAPASDSSIAEPPPSVISVVQQAEADELCGGKQGGRVVALLFSEEVTRESIQDRLAAAAITSLEPAANRAVGVALQPGRRIAFVALRDPIGPFVPRTMTVTDVSDLRGQVMTSQTLPIETTVGLAAGVVSGQVLQADGTPVPFANVRLFHQCLTEFDEPFFVGISSKSTDAEGRYSWDYVPRGVNRLVAVDTGNDEFRDLRFSVSRDGQRLNVDVVFLGRGTFQGRTLAEDGTPLKDTALRVTSLTDQSQYGATSDAGGNFTIARVPVGNIFVEAVNTRALARVSVAENIPFAGATTNRDLILLTAESPQQITLKTGTVRGHVLRADNASTVAGVPVIVFYQSGSQAGVTCPAMAAECAVALATTDADGAFAFTKVTAGSLRLHSLDQAALQEGAARVILPSDGTIEANLLLGGGLGTVRGVVLDAGEQRVAGARVGGGLSLATTNAQGEFVLIDVPVGHRTIVAVSDLLGTSGQTEVDLVAAGEEVNATIILPSAGSVAGTIRGADGASIANNSVYLFERAGGNIRVVGVATTDEAGGYRIDRVPAGRYTVSAFRPDFSDGNFVDDVWVRFPSQIVRADIEFRGAGGSVHGRVLDDDDTTPLNARVGISSDRVVIAGGKVGVGFQRVQNFKIVDTDLSGQFAFSGLFVGPFTLRAAGQFSPDPIALEGAIPAPGVSVEMNLRLQATSQITGTVFQPDGVTPVGANVLVTYKSDAFKLICTEDSTGEQECTQIPQGIQEVRRITDGDGRYELLLVNAGTFVLTAEDQDPESPNFGKMNQVRGAVQAGETAEIPIRLLGLGELTVRVFSSDAMTVIPRAKIEVAQLAYPNKKLMVTVDQGEAVFSGGDAFTEGPLVVNATDLDNGFSGRAAGAITRDGEQVTINVFLYDAAGTVVGTVFRPDMMTRVPHAEVVVRNSAGPLAFTVTDSNGMFTAETIPLGPFTVEVFEPATARRGSAGGRIDLDGQEVAVDVIELAVGVVRGAAYEAGPLTPLKGWTASISQSGQPTRFTTTSIDGGFSFPGTSQGAFNLSVSKAQIGSAHAQGSITREGEVVDIPLVVNIPKPAFGRVGGIVFNPGGTRAANSAVSLARDAGGAVREVTALTDGTFFFDDIPLGRFTVRAQAQGSQNAGSTVGELSFDGEIVDVSVTLVGITVIDGNVINANGTAADVVDVVLNALPSTGCGLGSVPIPCTQSVDPGDGSFAFINVPARTFTIVATHRFTGLKGAVGGPLNPGEHKTVEIVLAPSGSVSARILFGDGTPAAHIAAELITGTGASAKHFFTESGADGRIAFDGMPLGAYQLELFDPIGPGIARRSGTLAGDLDLGDVVLDAAAPTVSSITPLPSAVAVPRDQVIQIVFSEPVAVATVNTTNISISGPAGAVSRTHSLSGDDTIVTLSPLSPLQSETRYAVRVKGIKDRIGQPMVGELVSTFTTADITPPTAVDLSPASDANGVSIFSPIRVKFSEPFDPAGFNGSAITLSDGAGTVAGQIDFIFGNTVVVFTPSLPLEEDTEYHVEMSPAFDLSGNTQIGAVDYTFSTTDRTPPEILALIPPSGGTVVENAVAQVIAAVDVGHDVAFVDFFINDVLAFTDRFAPFEVSFQATPNLGAPGDQIRVSAVATDTSGNRGTMEVGTFVTIIADTPPTAVITAPANGISAHTGEQLTVVVRATDDLGVAQIAFKANTGKPQDAATRAINPASRDRAESFSFVIPANAVPGSTIVVEASAVDTKGQITAALAIGVAVLDSVPPVVTITGATSGAQVRPGQQVTAVVSAQDLGGITTITFRVSGAASSTQTRILTPAQGSVLTSFTFTVPANAQPTESVLLDAVATDQAGNTSNAPRVILPVADTVAPQVTLQTSSGSLEIVPGGTATLIAQGEDQIGVTRFDLSGSGAFTVAATRAISPPLGSAQALFTINVPLTAPVDGILNLQLVARDIAGNISAPALLSLTVKALPTVTLPSSVLIIAGETQQVPVEMSTAAPAGGLRIDFATGNGNVATVPSNVIVPEGASTASLTVTGVAGGTTFINASMQGVARGSFTVTVRGGVVRGTIFDTESNRVAGAQVTVTGGSTIVTTVSDANGEYFVEGMGGSSVTVKARKDTESGTLLLGMASRAFNRPNGFAHIDVVVAAAGSIMGTVFQANGQPVGEGVQVELIAVGPPETPRGTMFTDENGAFEFPLVDLGDYLIQASDIAGNRGRASASLTESGQELVVDVTFLGRGSVTGTVLGGDDLPVPNAQITFTSSHLFGIDHFIDTAVDGTFRFDDVFVGSFSVGARDPVTNLAASAWGSIASDSQVVNVVVRVAPYGNLQGTVYRSLTNRTVVPGARVTVRSGSLFIATTTDASGHYTFSFLPLGPFTVFVFDDATRGGGSNSGTLSVHGATATLDVDLIGQGKVVATVTDTDGRLVQGAWVTLHDGTGFVGGAASAADGTVVFNYVRAGNFHVHAGLSTPFADRGAVADGTVAEGGIVAVSLQLSPIASIIGTVFDPHGVAVPNAKLVLSPCRYTSGCPIFTNTEGRYRFDGVATGYTYNLYVYDGQNRLRAVATGVTAQADREEVRRDFTFVGLGTVNGRVLNPDGSSAANFLVEVRSSTPIFGGRRTMRTNAAGFYEMTGIPVGAFTVSTGDLSRGLLGDGEGAITTDGETVTLDILLQSNAIFLPVDRFDANDFKFDIQDDGSALSGTNFAFATDMPPNRGAFLLDVIADGSATRFSGNDIGTIEDGGHEVVTRQFDLAGLNVTRKTFVPSSGYFVRYLEILANPTDSPITVDVRMTNMINSAGFCDPPAGHFPVPPSVIATSSGDDSLDVADETTADRWVVIDDSMDADPFLVNTRPAVAFGFDGPDGLERTGAVSFGLAGSCAAGELVHQWNDVTMPAGETVAYLHFGAQQTSRAAAQASVERLLQLPPEALAGLSAEEVAQIRNFVVPADGLSVLAPLPPLTGTVTGHVLEGDAATVVPNVAVRLQSENLLFARTYSVPADAGGLFTFRATADAWMAIPLDAFTLTAIHPRTQIESPESFGSFPAGQTTAIQDVVFSNTAVVRGVVRRHTGTPATSGTVLLYDSSDTISGFDDLDALGTYVITGVLPGQYRLDVTIPNPQAFCCDVLRGTATVLVTAGASVTADITIEPTGALEGMVRTGAGDPAAGLSVQVRKVGLTSPTGSVPTGIDGRYQFTDLPAGTYSVSVVDPVTGITSTAEVTVVQDGTATQDLMLIGRGAVQLQVSFGSGRAASGVLVEILEAARGLVRIAGVTDAAGSLIIADVPAGSFTVYATAGAGGSGQAAGTVVNGQTASVAIILPGFGTVTGLVKLANGAPAANVRISFGYDPFFTGTDALTQTDAYGRYTIGQVSVGRPFTIRAHHPLEPSLFDFFAEGRSNVAVDGDFLTADLTLPAVGEITGTVTFARGAAALNASVEVSDMSYSRTRFADGDGFFRLTVPADRPMTLRAQHPVDSAVERVLTGVTIPDNTTVTHNIVLPALATVRVTVRKQDGTAFSNVQVFSADSVRTAFQLRGTTDEAGQVAIVNIPEGPFTVRSSSPQGAILGHAAGTVGPGDDAGIVDVTIETAPLAGNIEGTVLAADASTRVRYARVEVRDAQTGALLAAALADGEGTYHVANIVAGSEGFVVRASPLEGGGSGERTAAFTINGETVVLDVTVAAAVVRGTVTFSDGIALPYPSVTVSQIDAGTTRTWGFGVSDAAGRYEIVGPAAGDVVVTVESATGLAGSATGTVTDITVPVTVDVVLEPSGTVRGTVFDGGGSPVPGVEMTLTVAGRALELQATADNQGRYQFDRIALGSISVRGCDKSTLPHICGNAAGTLSNDGDSVTIDVFLPAIGTVVGTVLDPGNGIVVPFAEVALVTEQAVQTGQADVNGVYRFDRVMVGPVYLQARQGGLFASATGELFSHGQSVTVDIQFRLGMVAGTVRAANGTPVADADVFVSSFGSPGPLYHFNVWGTTDSSGHYEVPVVPVGAIRVEAYGVDCGNVICQSVVGIAGDTLIATQPLLLDVTLGTASEETQNLDGADGFRYDVDPFYGALQRGGTIDGSLRSYDDAYNATGFIVNVAELGAAGRQVTLGPTLRVGETLLKSRKVFVSSSGGFARYLEVVTNPTNVPLPVTVDITGYLSSDTATSTVVSPAASGNTFAVTDSGGSCCIPFASCCVPASGGSCCVQVGFGTQCCSPPPALAHVFGGAGAVQVSVTEATFYDDGAFQYGWQTTVPPYETVIFMHFAAQRDPTDAAGAQIQAEALVNGTDPAAFVGMSAEERQKVVNFNAVSDAPSGTVTGAVTYFDGGIVPFAEVTVISSGSPLFKTADSQGMYQLADVALGMFTVEACAPDVPGLCGMASGSLAGDGDTAVVNVRLPATGTLTGHVLRLDGTPEPLADVALTSAEFDRFTQADDAGLYTFLLVPLGPFALQARFNSTFSFANASGELLTPGATLTVDLQLHTGTVMGTAYAADGMTPRPGTSLFIESISPPGPLGQSQVRFVAVTDSSGHYAANNIPTGRIAVSAHGPGGSGAAGGTLGPNETLTLDVTLTLGGPPR